MAALPAATDEACLGKFHQEHGKLFGHTGIKVISTAGVKKRGPRNIQQAPRPGYAPFMVKVCLQTENRFLG